MQRVIQMNCVMIGLIGFLLAMIHLFLSQKKKRNWREIIFWLPSIIAFMIAIVMACCG